MKVYKRVFFVLLLLIPFVSKAQNKEHFGKLYFFEANKLFIQKDLDASLIELNKAKQNIGNTNVYIECLFLKIYVEKKDWESAKKTLALIQSFKPTNDLLESISLQRNAIAEEDQRQYYLKLEKINNEFKELSKNIRNKELMLEKENNRRKYIESIKSINKLMSNNKLEDANKLYERVFTSEFYKREDIVEILKLEEFSSYKQALEKATLEVLLNHTRLYGTDGIGSNELNPLLKSILLAYIQDKMNIENYLDAIQKINIYLNYFPNDENYEKVNELLRKCHQYRQFQIIEYADRKMNEKSWKDASEAYNEYIQNYPSSIRFDYAKKRYKKAINLLNQWDHLIVGPAFSIIDYDSYSLQLMRAKLKKDRIGGYFDFGLGIGIADNLFNINSVGINYKVYYPLWVHAGLGGIYSRDGFEFYPEFGLTYVVVETIAFTYNAMVTSYGFGNKFGLAFSL